MRRSYRRQYGASVATCSSCGRDYSAIQHGELGRADPPAGELVDARRCPCGAVVTAKVAPMPERPAPRAAPVRRQPEPLPRASCPTCGRVFVHSSPLYARTLAEGHCRPEPPGGAR